jgi:hypothetical protein
MRIFPYPALCLVALLSACSTPQSRIEADRSAFDQFPAEVREKIRAGRVELGFTPEMVRLALGEPARQAIRKTVTGDLEIWIYTDHRPEFSLGFGVGSAGSHGGVGLGMETGPDGYEPDEQVRVEFRAGHVEKIEYRKR